MIKPGTIDFFSLKPTQLQQRPKLYVKLVPEMITTSHALVHTSSKETNGFIQTINASGYDCLYIQLSLCSAFYYYFEEF